jgi:hypothetical protein
MVKSKSSKTLVKRRAQSILRNPRSPRIPRKRRRTKVRARNKLKKTRILRANQLIKNQKTNLALRSFQTSQERPEMTKETLVL